MKILALDPALRNTGYVIAEYNGSSFKYLNTGVIKTPKSEFTGLNVLSDCNLIIKSIDELLPQVDIVCSELNMMSQTFSNAVTNGAVVAILAHIKQVKPLLTVTTYEAKRAVSEHLKVDKLVCMGWASNILPNDLVPLHRGAINQLLFNHIADALAVLHSVKSKLDTIMKAKISISNSDIQQALVASLALKGIVIKPEDVVLFEEETKEAVGAIFADIELDVNELGKLADKPKAPVQRKPRTKKEKTTVETEKPKQVEEVEQEQPKVEADKVEPQTQEAVVEQKEPTLGDMDAELANSDGNVKGLF